MVWWKICIDSNLDLDCQENNEQFNVTNNNWYIIYLNFEKVTNKNFGGYKSRIK